MAGEVVKVPAGTFCWNELVTRDVGAAKTFYTQLFGWTVVDEPMGPMQYSMLQSGGKNVGGMMAMPKEAGPAPSHWMAYVSVADCDAMAEKATALGGKVIVPPMDVPGVGRFSLLQDPTGAVISVIRLGN